MRALLILLIGCLISRAQPLPIYAGRDNSSLILDAFPGATAAYSVRCVRSAYTGPLVRIRRSNDNAELDIYRAGEHMDTNAIASFCSANTGTVSRWYDQTTTGSIAYTTNAVGEPRIFPFVTYGSTGRIGLRNPNTSDFHFYLSVPFSGAQPWTMQAIWTRGGTSDVLAVMVFLSKLSNAPSIATDAPGTTLSTAILYCDTTTHYSSYDTGTTTSAIMSVIANSSAENCYFGATQLTNIVNHSTLSGGSNFEALGFATYGFYQNIGHRGSMQEVIFWPADKTSTRLQILTNQNNYFGYY